LVIKRNKDKKKINSKFIREILIDKIENFLIEQDILPEDTDPEFLQNFQPTEI
jgi:hypothetical protein